MEDNQPIICRHCFADESELDSELVYTCACKNPICELCFEAHLNNKKNNQCEICRRIYQHHLLNLYIDPVHWLLTKSGLTLLSISLYVIILNCGFFIYC